MLTWIKITAVVLVGLFVAAFVMLPPAGTIPVLMYHFIDTPERAAKEGIVVSQKSFAFQMAFLRFFKYRVISLDELSEIKRGLRRPEARSVAITFDDGNYTILDNAYPVLKRYAYPVAVFVVSESVKGTLHGSMSAEQVRQLAREDWITIGSHSKTHPLLSRMDDAAAAGEIEDSKKYLEELLGKPVYYLSYPSGDYDLRVAGIVKQAGYRLAFTTSYKKLVGSDEGLYALTRIKINHVSDNPFVFWFQISGLYQIFKHELKRTQIEAGRSGSPEVSGRRMD